MKKIKIGLWGATGRMGKTILDVANQNKMISIGAVNFVDNFDVIIDFTSPAGLEQILKYCLQKRIPLISGTTGLSEKQFKKIKLASKKIPILWSANMSIGIAAIKKIIPILANLEGFEAIITDIHHRHKKDSPSGTAISIKKVFEENSSKKINQIASFRLGGIVGIHQLLICSDEESILIEHSALDRKVFAKGSLRAAEWLFQKKLKSGFYEIGDMVGAS